jgi:hypothetical protein
MPTVLSASVLLYFIFCTLKECFSRAQTQFPCSSRSIDVMSHCSCILFTNDSITYVTGSMSSYIAAVQSNVQRIVTEVAASEKCSVRFGLVSYRDHPPQDSSYITKVFDFTENLDAMRANVNTMVCCSQCYPITVSTVLLAFQYCSLTFITLLLYTALHA